MDWVRLQAGRRVRWLLVVSVDHIGALRIHLLLEQRVLIAELGLLLARVSQCALSALAQVGVGYGGRGSVILPK